MTAYFQARKQSRSAFSLIEIIVAMAVLLIIALLVMSAFQGSFRRAENLTCIANLRTVGKAMQTYIADMGNNVVTRSGGDSRVGGDMWAAELSGRGYLFEHARADKHRTYTWKDQQTTSCPVGRLPDSLTDQNWVWYTYGLNMFTPGSKIVQVSGTSLSVRNIASEDPSRLVLLADSLSSATGYQTFRIRGGSSDGIELRHSEKANVLFLDGHIESVDRHQAEILKFPKIYD